MPFSRLDALSGLMAMVFSVLSAFGVEWASKTQDVREDSAIAGVWALGMALGVILYFLLPAILLICLPICSVIS